MKEILQREVYGYLPDLPYEIHTGEALLEGRVGYFKVDFLHFLSRHCWHRYLQFIEQHKND